MQSCISIAHIEFASSPTLRSEAKDGTALIPLCCLTFIKGNCQRSGIDLVRHCKHFAVSELHMAHALSTDTSPISTTAMDGAFAVWMFTCKVGRFTGMNGGQVAKLANSVENSELQTSRIPKPVIRVPRCLSHPCISLIPLYKGEHVARKDLNALRLVSRSLCHGE